MGEIGFDHRFDLQTIPFLEWIRPGPMWEPGLFISTEPTGQPRTGPYYLLSGSGNFYQSYASPPLATPEAANRGGESAGWGDLK
jgi:hypothetical protein